MSWISSSSPARTGGSEDAAHALLLGGGDVRGGELAPQRVPSSSGRPATIAPITRPSLSSRLRRIAPNARSSMPASPSKRTSERLAGMKSTSTPIDRIGR